MRSRLRSAIARAGALAILGVLLASALIPSAGSAVTIQPGVIFQPSQSWANLSFSSTQTFNSVVVDASGVTFDTVRFGVRKYPQALPRVEILIGTWVPLQTTANATSVRFTATAPSGSIVEFNFTYLLANREYFLQVDGVEQARKFTTASGHVSFPWAAWSTHDFNVLLGPGSGGPPNTCPNQPMISGTPPITTFPGSGVTFGGLSSDSDADPLAWTWTWDDGTTTDQSTPPGIGQVTASHVWAVAGSYNVSLSVTDAICVVVSEPFEVDVIPRPAQVGFLAGAVRDATSLTPIEGPTIASSPGTFGQTTDVQGTYNVTVPVGTYMVTVGATFYVGASRSGIVVGQNRATIEDFNLIRLSANVTAAFDFTVDGSTVRFTDRSRTDGTLPITSHLWAFGDGTLSMAASPTHTYAVSGFSATYTVTLMACDAANHCGALSKDITLINWPLVVVAVGPLVGLVLVAVALILWWRRRREEEEGATDLFQEEP